MLNSIVIMGRLTKDPELRTTQSGKPVTNFTLACDRDFQQDKTEFISVVCWGATAEFAVKYFRKGRMCIAAGSLQSRKWTDNSGNNRTDWEVNATSLYFGDSKKNDGHAQLDGGNHFEYRASTPDVSAEDFQEAMVGDDDLPF